MKSILPRLTMFIWAAAVVIATAPSGLAANALAATSSTAPHPAADASTPVDRQAVQAPAVADPRITVGDQLLLQAIAQLERRESAAARLQFRASVGGQSLSGAGSYWQQGSGDALRVRLELRVTGQTSLLQVSNGRFLWIDRQLATGRTVNRLDLRRIRADAARAAAKLDELQPGQASWSPNRPGLTAYYGGLPKLLSAMSESFPFPRPQMMRFQVASADGTQQANLPVFAVVGHWKRSQLARILPTLGESASDEELHRQLALLPPRLPQEVLLLLGQADLFPYRIEYRKLVQPSPAAASGAPTPYQLSTEPMVLVEFSDVSFDVPIGPGQFDYAPPSDARWDDLTAEHLDKIRRLRDEQLAARIREPTL
jgi:hypothetical protein